LPQGETAAARELCLIVRVGPALYALPAQHVAETMRPQPVRRVSGSPSCVLGVATIRGVPVPVVQAASLLTDDSPASGSLSARFVSLTVAGRQVALAVDEVLGVRRIESSQLSGLPPLLSTAKEHLISSIAVLDGQFLMVLESGKLLSDAAWAAIGGESHS
jgi:purine-binding chemotaxis protein CheW